jgi:hypothetical protein
VRFTLGRYPSPRYSHNTDSFTTSTGNVRVIVSEGLVVDKNAFKKLRTNYKLTPQHRIGATSKVVALTSKQRAAEKGEVYEAQDAA